MTPAFLPAEPHRPLDGAVVLRDLAYGQTLPPHRPSQNSEFLIPANLRRQSHTPKQNLNFPLFDCPEQTTRSTIIPSPFSLYTKHPDRYPVHLHWGFKTSRRSTSYQEQLDQAINQKHDLLLSGEDMESLEADELQKLLGDLCGCGRELIAFACVRSPYAFHCSQVQQQVKDGVAMNPAGLCPQRHRIRKLKQVFGSRCIGFHSEACNIPKVPSAFLGVLRH